MAGTAGAALAFVVSGIAIILIALTYAELAAALPKIGGEHVYAHRAFGRHASFLCTWALLLGYVAVVAFEVVALPVALLYLFPGIEIGLLWEVGGYNVYAGQVAIGIGVAVILTIVNVRGIEAAAGLQGFVTSLILIAGLMFVGGAASAGSFENMLPLFVDEGVGALGVLVMLPILFVGFDIIPQAAEEINLPPARIGSLLIISVVAAVVWYVSIVLAVGYALDEGSRVQSVLTTAEAAATTWDGAWAGAVLVCGGIAGIITSWNAMLVASSRLLYALASSDMFPAWFATLHNDHGSPARALWLICGVSCLAPWFGRPILVWLLNAGSLGVVIAYAVVALAFLALRRNEPDLQRPYRVPYGRVCGATAFVIACTIGSLYLPWSPVALAWPEEWLICGVWSLCGAVMYLSCTKKMELKSI